MSPSRFGARFAWLVAAALMCATPMLAGCVQTKALVQNLTGSQTAPVTIAKAEYAFEATYNVAGNAYLAAVKSGTLSPTVKAQAKGILADAYRAVKLARAAQAAGDAQGVAAQAAAVTALVNQVLQLVEPK